MTTVAIITPTIGSRHLTRCVESVARQQCPDGVRIRHIVVADGINLPVDEIASVAPRAEVMRIPWRTGANRWNGHRIYASVPWLLVDVDFVSYLDEDNSVSPSHVSSLLSAAKGHTWSFALRRIVDKDGRPICYDACESLGNLRDNVLGDRFVDTSCYLVPLEIAQKHAECWMRPARPLTGPEVDRLFYREISGYPHACSGEYSVDYRVGDARADSVQASFFVQGNRALWGRDMSIH